MAKQMIYSDEVWKKLEAGVDKVANAVKITIGPRGHNVVLEKQFGSPTITNDGVTIAKEIQLEDQFENMGAQLLIEIASKANDVAGDGTTTAAILGQAIFKNGLKNVTMGANAMAVKRGINKAVEIVLKELKNKSVPIQDKQQIIQVARISANDDESIGKIIADAMDKVGKDGVITVEESKGMDTTLEVVEGLQFDRGYVSPYFTNNPENTEAILNNPLILITDKKISSIKELIPTLEKVVQASRSLLIIAEDVEGEALATLVVNKLKGVISAVAIKAPDFGSNRKAILEDICTITKAEFISEDLGGKLENIQLTSLGSAKTIKVSKEKTTIIQGSGDQAKIKERIEMLKKQLETLDNEHEKDKIKDRIARLSSGVAIIYAGAATETELKEKKYRIEDALNATRAAVEEGIVAGGGVALVRCLSSLESLNLPNEDEQIGIDIVRKAIIEPLKQISINSGCAGDVVLSKILESTNVNIGFNALDLTYTDMFKAGIVDPLKITKSALQNAASIAGMLLTTGCLIATKKEEVKNQQPQMQV